MARLVYGIQYKINTMLAYANGKDIEKQKVFSFEEWQVDPLPLWNWEEYEYRTKED